MKLAIDCRGLTKNPTGIPGFLISAINSLVDAFPHYKLYLLSHKDFSKECKTLLRTSPCITIIIDPFFLFPEIGSIWYLFKASRIVNQLKVDVFWAPATLLPPFLSNKIGCLVTVHDVVVKKYKSTMSWPDRILSNFFYDRSVRKANIIWANSLYTRNELTFYFPELENKQIFIGCSINEKLFRKICVTSQEKQDFLIKYNIKDKILLFVGTLEPRKNLIFLLSLMPKLAKKEYYLIVVGTKGWGTDLLKEALVNDNFPKERVIFPGYITSSDLVKLYNIADVYVSTSLNEGFGLPQLEAMACCCPVISPHNSAMIEVVEGAGETVKGWSAEDWIEAIDKVYNNREYYIEKGLKRKARYSWHSIINKLGKVLEKEIVDQNKF